MKTCYKCDENEKAISLEDLNLKVMELDKEIDDIVSTLADLTKMKCSLVDHVERLQGHLVALTMKVNELTQD